MGGITIVDPTFEDTDSQDPRGKVLSFEWYKELVASETTFKLPKITMADIKDKSKGDFLSKLIAILQTSWFIIQCAARGVQGLALTEFELVTLALASLNAITFVFWWHKPLDVQEPIRLYLKIQGTPPEADENAAQEVCHSTTYHHDTDLVFQPQMNKALRRLVGAARNLIFNKFTVFKIGFRWISHFLQNPHRYSLPEALRLCFITFPYAVSGVLTLPFVLFVLLGVMALLSILTSNPVISEPLNGRGLLAIRILAVLRKFRRKIAILIGDFFGTTLASENFLLATTNSSSFAGDMLFFYFFLPAAFIGLLLITTTLIPFFAFFFLVSFIFTSIFEIFASSTVPPGATHVPSFYAPSTSSDSYSRMVVFALFGVIFGSLHCIGWHFTYPSSFERTLWRVTSLTITIIPFIVAPIDFMLENVQLEGRLGKMVRLTLDLIMTVLLFVYVPTRLSLIAQAIALLRNQPPTAFLAIDWTKFIPHVS